MFQQPNLPPGLSLLLALKKAQKRDPNTTSNKLKTTYCIGWNKFGKLRQLRKCKVIFSTHPNSPSLSPSLSPPFPSSLSRREDSGEPGGDSGREAGKRKPASAAPPRPAPSERPESWKRSPRVRTTAFPRARTGPGTHTCTSPGSFLPDESSSPGGGAFQAARSRLPGSGRSSRLAAGSGGKRCPHQRPALCHSPLRAVQLQHLRRPPLTLQPSGSWNT